MKTLYELANQLPDELDKAKLINDNGTYCIAGWMLHEAGIPDTQIRAFEEANPNSCSIEEDVWLTLLGTLYGLPVYVVEDLVHTNDQAHDGERLEVVQCELLKIVGEECN